MTAVDTGRSAGLRGGRPVDGGDHVIALGTVIAAETIDGRPLADSTAPSARLGGACTSRSHPDDTDVARSPRRTRQ
jgi:hypothetical protein